MKKYRVSSLILSLIVWTAAVMLPSAASADRQRASSKSEEIVGIVTQVSATSLTIRTSTVDRDVRLTSTTVVRVDDHLSTVSAIAVGDKVEAHAQKETDGTSTALVVEVESHPSTELEGTVKSLTATALTLTTSTGDVAITLTATTRFLVNGQTASASDVHAGDHVEVEVREQTDKTLTALVVKVQSESVDLRGVLTAASASSITVRTTTADVVVAVTSSTLIRMQGKVVNASALVVGSRVEVEAVRKADQTLAAVSITIESPTSLAEVEGSVTAVGTSSLTVHTKSGDNITIAVTTDTIIRAHDLRIGLSDIKAGNRVHVDARVNADGSFTALRVEVENESGSGSGNDDHSTDLTGVIASVSSGSIGVTAGGKTVTVKIASTTIIRRGSATLSPADLKAGNVVEVKGQLNADGSVTATLIQVEDTGNDDHHESVEFTGTVTAVSSTSLTVNSEGHTVTAALSSSTVVKNGDHTASLSDLKTGQHVEVHADRKTDGSLAATQVKIDH